MGSGSVPVSISTRWLGNMLKMLASFGKINQPNSVPFWEQCSNLPRTWAWLWSGERISIAQSGWVEKRLAILPDASRGMRSQGNTAISRTMAASPTIQRSSGKASAIFVLSASSLIVATSLPWRRLCSPWGLGFWLIFPSIYSEAGLVSGRSRNSSKLMDLTSVLMVLPFLHHVI